MLNAKALLDRVRPRPPFIDRLPGISPNSGTAMYPYIYVGRRAYENLLSDEPDQSNVALVLHEQEHITRIQELGIVNWYRHYFFSRTFRLEEELAAIKPQFNHLKRSGISVDIEHRARMLCGGAYLWPTSYDNAYSRLSAIWEAAPFPMQGAAAA